MEVKNGNAATLLRTDEPTVHAARIAASAGYADHLVEPPTLFRSFRQTRTEVAPSGNVLDAPRSALLRAAIVYTRRASWAETTKTSAVNFNEAKRIARTTA